MKKLLSCVLTLVLLCALLAVPAQAAGSGSLSASSASGYRGDTVTVDVYLNSNPGLITMKFQVSYSANLTLVSVSNSGLLNGWTTPAPTISSPYTLRWADSLSTTNNTATGKLATLTFKINENAKAGTETVSILFNESRDADGGKNSFSGAAASITIKCNHSYSDWKDAGDGNHSQTCPGCDDTKTEAHKWDKGTVIEPATCKDAGKTKYTCTVCKATKEENAPAADPDLHKFGNLTAVDDNNHKDTCQVCKKEITSAHAWDKGTVTKEPTCKETGIKKLTCGECGHTKNETIPIPDPAPHKFGNLTAVDDKNHKDTCQVCNKEITSAHTWNSGSVTKQPTCTEEGEKTFTCTGCKATKKESVDKLDHKFGAWEKVDADTHKRTCTLCKEETETGKHSYNTSWSKDKDNHWHECADCKDKKDSEAHKKGPEATEKDPQICTVCEYIITPALGHEHNYADKWTTDEKGHWYVCDGCEEKGSYKDHDFENACDKDCSVCGFTRETEHTFDEKWSTDGENHWHECTGCGLKKDEGAHEPGPAATETSAQTCTICDYEVAPKLEPAPVNKAPVEDPNNFPWWIVVVGAVALVVVILVFATKKKKV